MENPGYTIFQGGESIKVDTSLNRIEEEEALEDQKRRNEELGNQLQFAFDDLIDEDDCTVDSSYHNITSALTTHHSANKESEIPRQQTTEHGQGDHITCRDDIGKLEKTIESKNREIENISKLVFEERKKNDELKKRLALSEAEKERALMQKQQTHELLVESKTQISELDDSITKLKAKIKNLEDKNNDLVGELERTKTMLVDCQHKYHLVERNAGLNADKHADAIIKQMNERHNAQIQMMQHQVDNLKGKLDEKENEYRTLDTRYKELQRSREALLVEKAETINELARALEDSQRQCQLLMAKQDFTQENIRLQRLVSALERQTEDMQKTINNLTARLESTTAELELMDSVICENGASPRRLSQANSNIVGSTPLTVTDRITKLKNELYRSMASQKQKREEIKKLQDELSSKNDEIKKLKEYENKMLVEIEMLKDEKLRFESKIQALELELHKVKLKSASTENSLQGDFNDKIAELKNKNEKLETQLKRAQKEYNNLQENDKKLRIEIEELRLKLKYCKENEEDLTTKLKNLTTNLEEMKKENEKLKKLHEFTLNENERLKDNSRSTEESGILSLQLEKYKFLLKDAQSECDRIKKMYIEVSSEKDTLSAELDALKSQKIDVELKEVKEKCIQIEKALQLSEMKCNELQKLLDSQRIAHEKEISDLRSRLEKEKTDSIKSQKENLNNCTKCLNNLTEISKHEIENLKLRNQCSEYLNAQIELENRLKEAQSVINDLREKLTLKNDNDRVISDLKIKAQQFEEFIRNQNSSNGSSSGISSPRHHITNHHHHHDNHHQVEVEHKSVETSPELNENYDSQQRRRIESEIRNEMAKVFAIEMKKIEKYFKQNINELEEQNTQLKNDLYKINVELKHRQNEVQILKHAILAEREKMQEMFKTYEEDTRKVIEKHKTMLNKCRDELQSKTQRIDELVKELSERNTQIESERNSMKAVMVQWEEQKKQSDEQMDRMKMIIENHDKVVEQLQSKYNSIKKTASNYKLYIEAKEKHLMSEYERLKSEYDASVVEIERRMKERIKEIESNYDKKLEEFKKQFENHSKKGS